MDPKAAVMIASMVTGTIAFCAAVYGWGKWVSRPRQPLSAPDVSPEQNARLYDLERAIESIAVEVERIGEGQRHTSKVLAERSAIEQAMLRPAPGYRPMNTPH